MDFNLFDEQQMLRDSAALSQAGCRTGAAVARGIGMTEEYPVGHCFRYLTAFEKIHGDIDFHLQRMALGAA